MDHDLLMESSAGSHEHYEDVFVGCEALPRAAS